MAAVATQKTTLLCEYLCKITIEHPNEHQEVIGEVDKNRVRYEHPSLAT
jgi:hypothetical protein